MQFVVLSSSRGTVFKSVLNSIKEGSLKATCLGLISDSNNHGCVEIAKSAGLPVKIIERAKNESREDYDKKIHEAILALTPPSPTQTLVCCMGWMWLLSPWFVNTWRNKILNVHPSLLPKYPGTHAHDLVMKNGDNESGMTIHLIDEGEDTGKILVQKKCFVLASDTIDTLRSRVQALECEWYPNVLQQIEEGSLALI